MTTGTNSDWRRASELDTWLPRLHDAQPMVRYEAIRSLAPFGACRGVFDALLERLGDVEQSLRSAVVEALAGRSGEPCVIEMLLVLLDGDRPGRSSLAGQKTARVLAAHTDVKGVAQALRQWLSAQNARYPAQRQTLRAWTDERTEMATAALERLCESQGKDTTQVRLDLGTIAPYVQRIEFRAGAIVHLYNPGWEQRLGAVQVLSGQAHQPDLRIALQDRVRSEPHPLVRAALECTLENALAGVEPAEPGPAAR